MNTSERYPGRQPRWAGVPRRESTRCFLEAADTDDNSHQQQVVIDDDHSSLMQVNNGPAVYSSLASQDTSDMEEGYDEVDTLLARPIPVPDGARLRLRQQQVEIWSDLPPSPKDMSATEELEAASDFRFLPTEDMFFEGMELFVFACVHTVDGLPDPSAVHVSLAHDRAFAGSSEMVCIYFADEKEAKRQACDHEDVAKRYDSTVWQLCCPPQYCASSSIAGLDVHYLRPATPEEVARAIQKEAECMREIDAFSDDGSYTGQIPVEMMRHLHAIRKKHYPKEVASAQVAHAQ